MQCKGANLTISRNQTTKVVKLTPMIHTLSNFLIR